jgi:hypothetical protein
MLWFPLEMEALIKKKFKRLDSGDAKFVVVYNIPEIFEKYFLSSPYVSTDKTITCQSEKNEPLPKFYNQTVKKHLTENV